MVFYVALCAGVSRAGCGTEWVKKTQPFPSTHCLGYVLMI